MSMSNSYRFVVTSPTCCSAPLADVQTPLSLAASTHVALQKRLQMKAELERLTKACATTEQQIHTPQQNQTAAGAGAGAGAAAPGAELPPAKKMRIADGSSATTDDAGGGGGGGGGTGGDGWYSLNAKGTKRLTVSVFKSMIFVSLREYYADKSSGEMKPGKKGVTMNLQEWHAFKKHAPACT